MSGNAPGNPPLFFTEAPSTISTCSSVRWMWSWSHMRLEIQIYRVRGSSRSVINHYEDRIEYFEQRPQPQTNYTWNVADVAPGDQVQFAITTGWAGRMSQLKTGDQWFTSQIQGDPITVTNGCGGEDPKPAENSAPSSASQSATNTPPPETQSSTQQDPQPSSSPTSSWPESPSSSTTQNVPLNTSLSTSSFITTSATTLLISANTTTTPLPTSSTPTVDDAPLPPTDTATLGSATPNVDGSSNKSTSGISPGVIGGIVVGIIALLALVGAVLFFLRRRRRQNAARAVPTGFDEDVPVRDTHYWDSGSFTTPASTYPTNTTTWNSASQSGSPFNDLTESTIESSHAPSDHPVSAPESVADPTGTEVEDELLPPLYDPAWQEQRRN